MLIATQAARAGQDTTLTGLSRMGLSLTGDWELRPVEISRRTLVFCAEVPLGLSIWAKNLVGRLAVLMLAFCGLLSDSPKAMAQVANFDIQELATKLQVGYAVRPIDVNGDGRLDIAIVDSKRVLWLENPTWQEHVVYSTPDAQFDNVCFAPHDVNGDGRVDFGLGADWQFGNSDSGGTIGWLEHTESGPWKYRGIASEPTTHRMQWVDLYQNQKPWLVVAPLKGRGSRAPGFDQTGVRLLAFLPSADDETWNRQVLTEQLHVMHNFDVTDLDDDGHQDMLCASYEGVTWLRWEDGQLSLTRLGSGQEQAPPQRGASEIRLGKLADGRNFIATVEPWHGDKIVVYVQPTDWTPPDQQSSPPLWPRFVLDDQLAWGHAIACVNLDGDADEELVVGVRDDREGTEHRRGLRIYDPRNVDEGIWYRQLVDPGGVAIEDLCVGDFDDDGDQDIVAVGRQTHNVKIYWNKHP